MAYTSFFGSSSGGSTATAAPKSGGGYQSFFGSTVAKTGSIAANQAAQPKVQPQKVAPVPKSQSLFSKVVSSGKSLAKAATTGEQVAAKGIARVLPGGMNDINNQAQEAKQANDAIAQTIADKKAGKINQTQATKLINNQAGNSAAAEQSQTKTIKAMPTTGQLAAGFGSTAADILTASTLGVAKAATTAGKIAEKGVQFAGNATAGGLNAAAGGGTKKQIVQNATAGALLPEVLHYGAKGVSKGVTTALDKSGITDTKALINNMRNASILDKVKNGTPPDTSIKSATNSLLDKVKPPDTAVIPEPKVPVNSIPDTVLAESHAKQAAIADASPAPPPVKQLPATVELTPKEKLAQTTEAAKVGTLSKNNTPTALLPSQTEHMPEIGGYTHSSDVVNDYAKMLKETDKTEPVKGQTPNYEAQAKKALADNTAPHDLGNVYKQLQDRETLPNTESASVKTAVPENAAVVSEQKANTEPKVSNRKQTEYKPNKPEPTYVPMKETPKTSLLDKDVKTSKLASRVEAIGIKKGLTEALGDKPEYAKVNMKTQADAATNLLKSDPDKLVRIAMGHEKPPEGLLPESAWVAAVHYATKTKDGELLRKLGTESSLVSEATGMGQRIRALGELNPHNPAKAIKDITEARKVAFERKNKVTAAKAVTKEVQAIRAAKPRITKETFSSFVESLKC